MTPDLVQRLRAVCAAGQIPSSDFDLNAQVQLSPGRRLRPAAVLIPVIEENGAAYVILTKRSAALKHHPGQIAFAGGKQDPEDADLVATALREAHEEIALHPDNVQVIGTLAQHETVTGFQVTPVVALVRSPFAAVAESGEVDEVFQVPLAHLLDVRNYRVEGRFWQGQMRHYYTVPYGPYYIWGATARMLRAWADLMT